MWTKQNKAIMTLAIWLIVSFLGTFIASLDCQSIKTIGVWLDKERIKNIGVFEQQLTLTQEGNKFFLTSNKGRANRFELIEVPAQPGEKRRFNEKNSRDLNMNHLLRKMLEEAQELFKAGKEAEWLDVFFTGNIYVIDENGNLDLYDKNGVIRKAYKIR